MSEWPFGDLKHGHYGAIYADPPWHFATWSTFKELPDGTKTRAVQRYYETASADEIAALPVAELAAQDCALFIWVCWPNLADAWDVISGWGFKYKTCAFSWIKANNRQLDWLREDADVQVGMGYWTRANNEVCLLATRGKPKRLNADVRQAIIEPRREHSRKPDCVPGRIEKLVVGPYVELFARQTRPGWDSWGNQTAKFNHHLYDADLDAMESYNVAVRACGERYRAGEPLGQFFLPLKDRS
jgi:N6-adenosine-specific RNA methylase IME4